jgi:excisionase family DNA binding protein
MSGSTFKILKQCLMCGELFEAQKVVTKYCSHRCNSKHYKLKVKLSKKANAEAPLNAITEVFKPKISALNRASIMEKPFVSVKEVAFVLGCSQKTVYSLIHSNRLKASNIGKKRFIIAQKHLNEFFGI